MTYKVIEKITVARDFKTREEAETYAMNNLFEDEDRSYSIEKE